MNSQCCMDDDRNYDYEELMKILDQKLITSVFQPIVNLQNGEVFGYEALSRGPVESRLARPDKLFEVAEKYKSLWKLDYFCRRMAILKAKDLLKDKMLFINVDPKVLYDKKFHQGSTLKLLKKCKMNRKNIVFEVSEKTAINDYDGFQAILENYRMQGYKIALDDMGSGYSGLTLLAKSSPQFIKIDIALIKDIDKDKVKQAIVKALINFSHSTNIKIIAEGIEKIEELQILIDLGVEYGQGFYLGKPIPFIADILPRIKESIKFNFGKKEEKIMNSRLHLCLGEIATNQTTFSSQTMGSEILNYLQNAQERLDIILVDEKKPMGLLSQEVFYSKLATTYGISVYSNRPVNLLMDKKPLLLDFSTSIEEAAKQAMQREPNKIYDSLIVVRGHEYYGTVTIKKLLEITTQIEINRAKYANPLTGLPGNIMIDLEIKRYITEFIPFVAIYVDLDNFKTYNDLYGFEEGDGVLVNTANILRESLTLCSNDFFLGHIGGDDFIILLKGEKAEAVCTQIIKRFDKKVKNFYSIEHQKQQYVITKDRSGKIDKFPLMSISLAVLSIKNNANLDAKTLAARAAKVKKSCKEIYKSNFIMQDYHDNK